MYLAHPELPSCQDCKTWLYDADWRRQGPPDRPTPRPAGAPLPCAQCPKSRQHNQPRPERELSPANWRAYRYFYECQADVTGLVPRDLTVVRNNGLIRLLLDQHDRAGQSPDLALALLAGLGAAGGKRA